MKNPHYYIPFYGEYLFLKETINGKRDLDGKEACLVGAFQGLCVAILLLSFGLI